MKKHLKSVLTGLAMTAALVACMALPSYADDSLFEPVYGPQIENEVVNSEVDQGPSINVLIDRVVGWAPNWIVEPIKIWANYLIIASSIFMLFLRLLMWFLPASISQRFNWILGPVTRFFRQLTRLLDVIALNSNSRMSGPNKNRSRG